MEFAINRLDLSSPAGFAASARRAEQLGWRMGLIPCSPLLVPDPYVMLAFAAEATQTLRLGTMLDTPVMRHPAALASSIATVASLAPDRTLLGLGVGDTAVRLNGLAPAKVANLEQCVLQARRLLAGDAIDVGTARPARLRHAVRTPVWVAAQGPRTLHMAGACADGVFIRVGTHPDNIQAAYAAVVAGAAAAGRDPGEIEIGLIFHTIPCEDSRRALAAARACAAGYYEYSKFLFDNLSMQWMGPPVEELKNSVWPDFHHVKDLETAGELVGFLSEETARAFSLAGSWDEIRDQLEQILTLDIPVSVVLPHPMVLPGVEIDYLHDCAENILAHFA